MSDEPNFGFDDFQEGSGSQAAASGADPEQIAFEIRFFEPVMERSPGFVEVLQLMGNHYTRAGRYEDGLAIDRRLVRLCPDDAIARYNLACSLALTRKSAAAVRELDRAVSLGYKDISHIDTDPDLDNVREHPDYQSLMRRLRNV